MQLELVLDIKIMIVEVHMQITGFLSNVQLLQNMYVNLQEDLTFLS